MAKKSRKHADMMGKAIAKAGEHTSDQQFEWLMLVLNGMNGTEAARQVGYANPVQSASRLKNCESLRPVLERMRQLAAKDAGITAQQVLWRYQEVLDIDLLELVNEDTLECKNLSEVPKWVRKCIQSITVEEKTDKNGTVTRSWKFGMMSKDNALNSLARHSGVLKEKVEVQHKVSALDMAQLLEAENDAANNQVIDADFIVRAANEPDPRIGVDTKQEDDTIPEQDNDSHTTQEQSDA